MYYESKTFKWNFKYVQFPNKGRDNFLSPLSRFLSPILSFYNLYRNTCSNFMDELLQVSEYQWSVGFFSQQNVQPPKSGFYLNNTFWLTSDDLL